MTKITPNKPPKTRNVSRSGRRRPSTVPSGIHTFRAPEVAWEKHRARSESMGLPPSRVLTMLVEAFAAGDLDLPTKVYTYPPKTAGASEETSQASSVSQSAGEALKTLGDDYDPESLV